MMKWNQIKYTVLDYTKKQFDDSLQTIDEIFKIVESDTQLREELIHLVGEDVYKKINTPFPLRIVYDDENSKYSLIDLNIDCKNIVFQFENGKKQSVYIGNKELVGIMGYIILIILHHFKIIELKHIHKHLVNYLYWRVLSDILEHYAKTTKNNSTFKKWNIKIK